MSPTPFSSSKLPPKFFEAMRLPKHLESLPPEYENVFKLDPEKEKALLRDNHVAPIREDVCRIRDLESLRAEYETAMKKKAVEVMQQKEKSEDERQGSQ
uniref:PET domain-containing protein n=1 Tax=Steinernema glaseri TaxID=37863 RepID=A0A1I7Z361_9BILA